MADSPHSAPMDVVRAAFEQLGWNMTPVNALEEQLETLRQRASAAETFIVQMDMAYRYEEFRETWESNPASDPFDAGGQVTHVHDPASGSKQHKYDDPKDPIGTTRA